MHGIYVGVRLRLRLLNSMAEELSYGLWSRLLNSISQFQGHCVVFFFCFLCFTSYVLSDLTTRKQVDHKRMGISSQNKKQKRKQSVPHHFIHQSYASFNFFCSIGSRFDLIFFFLITVGGNIQK